MVELVARGYLARSYRRGVRRRRRAHQDTTLALAVGAFLWLLAVGLAAGLLQGGA